MKIEFGRLIETIPGNIKLLKGDILLRRGGDDILKIFEEVSSSEYIYYFFGVYIRITR